MSKENGLLLAAVVVVALLVGGVYTLTSSNNRQAPAGRQIVQRPAAPAAAQAVPDPALCGNGLLDAGEDCDPLDPATAFNEETGQMCPSNCLTPLYADPLECMDDRHAQNCVDANDDPVVNYYDCVDAQYAYCQGLNL